MTAYSKDHEALVHYPVLQLDSGPWWGSVGSLAVHSPNTDSSGEPKTTETKQGKGVETHFTVTWADGQKNQTPLHPATSLHSAESALPNYHTWLEIGYSPSMTSAKYNPYADQSYKVLSAYGPQSGGRIMLPLSLTTDEGPIFVNAKQYHGIIRRRQSRAKAELLNKPLRVRKQYMHESRHLHAKRRARGAGGRFLNSTKSLNGPMEEEEARDMKRRENKGHRYHFLAQPTGSDQDSEVLQSDINRYPNLKETDIGGNQVASAEVVSNVYFHGDFNFFHIGIPQPSPRSIPNPIGHGQYDMVTAISAPKWAAAGVDCCNLKI